jgi:translation initiation factor 4E
MAPPAGAGSPWPLKYSWVIWYRPPTSKNSDYEKSTKPMCKISTAQQFWKVYFHLRRPSALPTVSDYHFFRDGIRPVWEDEENRRGGKWIIRLKRGVSDRYWEDLLMAMIGDQFAEAAEEVCGAVLSVRSGEDVFSIWTKNDGGRNIKIRWAAFFFRGAINDCRETVKRVLALPPDTNIVWKSHDDSIAQRSALDQARQDKTTQQEKRRATITEEDGNSAR